VATASPERMSLAGLAVQKENGENFADNAAFAGQVAVTNVVKDQKSFSARITQKTQAAITVCLMFEHVACLRILRLRNGQILRNVG
jgi:hypothetical protein